MSADLVVRLLYLILLGGLITHTLCCADDLEQTAVLPEKQRRYQPLLAAYLLPLYLLTWAILSLFTDFSWLTIQKLLAFSGQIFFYASLYFMILLPLLPRLRKRFSARSCAALWIVPTFFYIGLFDWYALDRPLYVLHLPTRFLPLLARIWVIGSLAVLGWRILQHLRFRRELLSTARTETDPAVLALWHEEQALAGWTRPVYQLMRSPTIRTPLSIGFCARTIRVMLPENSYPPQDLQLILRHELIHIGRQDTFVKLFLTLCTAMFWFNPLMWIACRRSADDMELSCDESVLLKEDASARRRYAELLLTTAGEERGFTTCLSASAKALQYRLKNVMHPVKRSLGAAVVAVFFALSALTFGMFTFSWQESTLGQELFPEGAGSKSIVSLSLFEPEDLMASYYLPTDEAALTELLCALPVERVAGSYDFPETGQTCLYVHFHSCYFSLTDDAVTIYPHGSYRERQSFHLPHAPDWATIQSLMTTRT